MRVAKSGAQIVVSEIPGMPNKIININSSHARITESDTGDPQTVSIVDGLYDVGYTDLLVNTIDNVGAGHTMTSLRAIIGS